MSNNHIVYTSDEITNLSKQKIWENNIINSPLKKNISETKYTLYSTGNADINGRKYVCIPENRKPTKDEIKKYNIW